MSFPHIVFGTPRKLPKPKNLVGRVAVLDIAFAAGRGRQSYKNVTEPFIKSLGNRLAIWIDHHDHAMHASFASDDRFILRTKAQLNACPELVTTYIVEKTGRIDTICCHTDFDGICTAAKWIKGGMEPYPGADEDARAIDTRIGYPSERAATIDRALRSRPNDKALRGIILKFLVDDANDSSIYKTLQEVANQLKPREEQSKVLAKGFKVSDRIAVVRFKDIERPYDKTTLLMIGQEKAPISVVCDRTTVTIATRFDSGINLLDIFGLEGGMPTVVSLSAQDLDTVLAKLGWREPI